ncbi:hypothetical protein [Xylanimonas ulmi]|uniref:Uncharacterized protein n=1 Tax=Xylanimonas ulmi TaxID=228973 RepID=A0A4Q7M258_9MICO|nr:hypothetical protein [Xylanibacterium ulmi]RZS61043.1 hypothetical protein EV386_1324 [Xylanibacterium ulmi]
MTTKPDADRPEVTFDPDVFPGDWFLAPGQWPWGAFATREQWAWRIATDVGADHSWDQPTVAHVAALLVAVDEQQDDGEWRLWTLVGTPERPTAFWASLFAGPRFPDAAEVTDLVAVDGTTTIVPPDVTAFVSTHLGTGVRAIRFVEAPDQTAAPDDGSRPVAQLVNYAFRHGEHDVVLMASGFDVDLVDALLPDLDAIALSVSVA